MPKAPIVPLIYNPAGAIIPGTGISADELSALTPRLEAARKEVLADAELWQRGGSVPKNKEPLDAGFHFLPDRLLAEYKEKRDASELGRILATARRISEAVDRVVVLGIGGSYMGARALFEACCHPYHNELSRGERGGWPRMYFEGNNVDNDARRACSTCSAAAARPPTSTSRWAIVVISKSGGTLETAAAFRHVPRRAARIVRRR